MSEVTFERSVSESTDDCRVWWNGTVWNIGLDLIVQPAGYGIATMCKAGGGMRFLDVPIPPKAIIKSATLSLVAILNEVEDVVRSIISGELNANPLTFSTVNDYFDRIRTVQKFYLDNIGWWGYGITYTSPSFNSVVQEIVNLPNWKSGNPLVIFWDDHDNRSDQEPLHIRRGASWDNVDYDPPKLTVTYSPPVEKPIISVPMVSPILAGVPVIRQLRYGDLYGLRIT